MTDNIFRDLEKLIFYSSIRMQDERLLDDAV